MNYIELINHFWQTRRTKAFSSNEADLYFALLQECNIRGWQNPFECSNRSIIATIGITEKGLIEVRNRLQVKGLIKFEKGKRKEKSPVYTLLYCNEVSINVSKTVSIKVSKKVSKNVHSFKTETETKTETNNIPLYPLKGENVSIPEIKTLDSEKKEKEKSSGKKEKFDLSFVNVDYLSIVKDFIEYRKQIKKPFRTEKGIKGFYNELFNLSGNNLQKAKRLVDYAQYKEWQTVYEIKENGTNQSNSQAGKKRNLEEFARHLENGIARAEGRN